MNLAVSKPKELEKLGQPRRRESHARTPEDWAKRAWWKRGQGGG